jgi:hypothetical protein
LRWCKTKGFAGTEPCMHARRRSNLQDVALVRLSRHACNRVIHTWQIRRRTLGCTNFEELESGLSRLSWLRAEQVRSVSAGRTSKFEPWWQVATGATWRCNGQPTVFAPWIIVALGMPVTSAVVWLTVWRSWSNVWSKMRFTAASAVFFYYAIP